VKGCQRSNQKEFCAVVFNTHAFWNDCVDWYGCHFGGKGFYRLGFKPINVDFTMGKRLLVHLQEFSVRDLVCVIPV